MLSLENDFREKILDLYQHAPLDKASFHRHYKYCNLEACLGMCCHGGVGFYMDDEHQKISELAKTKSEFFKKHNIVLPEKIFIEELNESTGKIELSTQTRDEVYPEGLMPAHFPATSCVFRRSDGACSLQLLSVEEGKSSWWYKPFACWLYPIELEWNEKPYIHVTHATTDEYVDETYPGFVEYTKCGAECNDGVKPAYIVLEHEIAQLSKLLNRDLLKEILG